MQVYSDKKVAAKRERASRIKLYFLFLFASLAAFAVFYLAVYSPVFKIESISVEGNEITSQDEVLRILRPIVIGTPLGGLAGFENLLAWPGGKITDPSYEISGIIIHKNWFKRTVRVEVEERARFAIWCVNSGEKCYWIDKRGIVFGEAPLTEGSLVSIVFDSRNESLFFGSMVEEERFADNLISILENFSQTNLTAKKINFDLKKQELSFSTEEGLLVIFGLRYDSAKSIPLIKDWDYGSKAKKYIDLTVENRILYQ